MAHYGQSTNARFTARIYVCTWANIPVPGLSEIPGATIPRRLTSLSSVVSGNGAEAISFPDGGVTPFRDHALGLLLVRKTNNTEVLPDNPDNKEIKRLITELEGVNRAFPQDDGKVIAG